MILDDAMTQKMQDDIEAREDLRQKAIQKLRGQIKLVSTIHSESPEREVAEQVVFRLFANLYGTGWEDDTIKLTIAECMDIVRHDCEQHARQQKERDPSKPCIIITGPRLD